LTNSRTLAFDLLSRVQKDDSYINLLLPSFLSRKGVDETERGLIQELAYGSLRWQLQYDSFIDHLANGKTIEQSVRIALRMGLHQLFRMRIPSHAAINETVELVKLKSPKAAGFSNAILRNADRAGLESLLTKATSGIQSVEAHAIETSHPSWMIRAFIDALALDSRKDVLPLLSSNNQTPKVNLAALSEAAMTRLDEAGLTKSSVSPIGYSIDGNPESYVGLDVRVQDFGSQIVALTLLGLAHRDSRVLDMCSGPGGKSAVLLSGLGENGSLDCFEPASHRAKLVRDTVGHDSRASVFEQVGQSAPVNSYDAVLLDAPCSGLGSIRRKPESRWRKSPNQLSELTKLQADLLGAGIMALRKGGVLLYSTCSPVISETNSQVVDALDRHPEIELLDLKPVLTSISPSLVLNPARKTVQLWTDIHETDSMFMAAFRRVG
jgi:16S rRNA (cytosine967-C5)-methyltransferase